MSTSQQLFQQAQHCLVGGVNSPVRAFTGVGGEPLFIDRGEGPYFFDVEGNRYIDYIGAWGPLILGHKHPHVLSAVEEALAKGLSFGAPGEGEIKLAEKICTLMPGLEKVRLVNSGTEATMTAIRLARGITGRDKMIKFDGCYHGHADSLLVKAGSGLLTLSIPGSPGVPKNVASDTLIAQYNDLASVERLLEEHRHEVAAVIVEPVAGNMNCVLPAPNFLPGLRQLCNDYQAMLIFDEVMSGFRVALGGAQGYFHVQPDITTLGKIIGGGMPVGAVGGKAEVMDHLAPLGGVYQAGTMSGNPIAMAAGYATLQVISEPGFFQALTHSCGRLMEGLQGIADREAIPCKVNYLGGMFGLFFTEEDGISTLLQVNACDVERFKQFFHQMLAKGVYFAPSAFESGFISSAHDETVVDETLLAAEQVFRLIARRKYD